MAYSLSAWFSQRTSLGVEGRMKKLRSPTMTVKTPSYESIRGRRCDSRKMRTRMNIHAQPAFPRTPSMFSIAAANRPEKAPESDAAEKNRAILLDEILSG